MLDIHSLDHALGTVSISVPELHLNSGDIHLLLGESGCGKTTLLKLISGFISPKNGTISSSESAPALLMQNPFYQIIASDVRGELAFPLRNRGFSDEDIESKIEKMSNEFKLNSLLDRALTDLSFGELQTVMLAATFIWESGLILLDEPTSHLHEGDMKRMYAYLKQRSKKGACILIASQYAEEFQYCDRILLMSSGGIKLNIHISELTTHLAHFEDEGIRFSKSVLDSL